MAGDAQLGTGPATVVRGPSAACLEVDAELVVEVLGALAGADGSTAVAAAPLPLLLEVAGVRAAAVVVREGPRVVVLASAGYDCGPMSAGGALPLDAGLPVTEAVRTGRAVRQGRGPGWAAVPFPRGRRCGALLLSLDVAPPEDLTRLERITRALTDALDRACVREQDTAGSAAVLAQLAPAPPTRPQGWEVAVRSLPYAAEVGGDALLHLADGRGGSFLVALDVCGAGVAAAVVARAAQACLTGLAPYVPGPDELLDAADRALRSTVGTSAFVTAVAVHVVGDAASVCTAGHPTPLLLLDGAVTALDVEPGLPLALAGSDPAGRPVRTGCLPVGAVVVLWTDGLTERRSPHGASMVEAGELVAGRAVRDLEVLADEVLLAAASAGAAGDDVSLLLARRCR